VLQPLAQHCPVEASGVTRGEQLRQHGHQRFILLRRGSRGLLRHAPEGCSRQEEQQRGANRLLKKSS